MNRTVLLSALLLLVGTARAQVNEIPNASFENWGGIDPVSYLTTNTPDGFLHNVIQSGDAQHGSTSVQLIAQVIPPTDVTTAGSVSSCISNNCRSGEDIPARDQLFPITRRYTHICGYYKATFEGGDQLFIAADMLVESGGVDPDPVGGTNLATGDRTIPEPADDWTFFQKPITYIPGYSGTPDYTFIAFILVGSDLQANNSVSVNSTAFVDNVFFCSAGGDPDGPGGDGGDDEDGVLFIVDNASSMNASDQAIQNLIESLAEDVTVVSDEAVTEADADERELIVVSATVDPAAMQADFSASAKPLLSMEAEGYSALGMTGSVADTDFGATEALTSLSVIDGSHPIANGFSGSAEVYVSASAMMWGQPGASSSIVAEDASGRATIFTYEQGQAMVNGDAVPPPLRRTAWCCSKTPSSGRWAAKATSTARWTSKRSAPKCPPPSSSARTIPTRSTQPRLSRLI